MFTVLIMNFKSQQNLFFLNGVLAIDETGTWCSGQLKWGITTVNEYAR